MMRIGMAWLVLWASVAAAAEIPAGIERAHEQFWARFIEKKFWTILDHADMDGRVIIPTAEESKLGKPNALAWWCSNENGSMFGGMYLDAMINRWKITGREEDKLNARRIAGGLMKLASVSGVKGFLARGVADDGVSHHPMGSNDQTSPWLYGMWRYVRSDIPSLEEKREVREKIIEVGEVLRSSGWRMPAEEPFRFRGSFNGFDFNTAPRLLFLVKIMGQLTGEGRWEELYQTLATERNPRKGPTRLEACRSGMVFEAAQGTRHSWTGAAGVICLRGLWELESDPAMKAAYAEGLRKSAELAAGGLPLGLEFNNDDAKRFELDWRVLNEMWTPQKTEMEAQDLAIRQLKKLGTLSPRRGYEMRLIRESTSAAWVVTLCPEREFVEKHRAMIEKIADHLRYEKLYVSQFFGIECAAYQMMVDGRK